MTGAYLGIGAASTATAEDIRALVETVLLAGGQRWADVVAVATTERLATDPRLWLGPPVLGFGVDALGAVETTTTSARALAAIGSGSVAEAAALLAAGPGSRLLVPKQRAGRVTAALAGL